MIAVHRGAPPVELNRNIHELAPDQRRYNNLSADTKTALKKSLLESQGHICAYCMRRIDGPEDAKLECLARVNSTAVPPTEYRRSAHAVPAPTE